jgi:hypothetical protein
MYIEDQNVERGTPKKQYLDYAPFQCSLLNNVWSGQAHHGDVESQTICAFAQAARTLDARYQNEARYITGNQNMATSLYTDAHFHGRPKPHTAKQAPLLCAETRTQDRCRLPSERGRHLVRPPVHLDLPRIYILINTDTAVIYIVVLLLTFPEHLEDKITTNCRIVGIAKMLVDTLFEGFDAFADFFGVI